MASEEYCPVSGWFLMSEAAWPSQRTRRAIDSVFTARTQTKVLTFTNSKPLRLCTIGLILCSWEVKIYKMSAKWTKLVSLPGLQRSSHCLSTVGDKAYIYGGELLPREPLDANVQIVDLTSGECT